MAVALGDSQDVLDAADQHRVGLVKVELQVAEQDDVARAVGGEHAVEQLEGVQRIGAGGDAAFFGIDQSLTGGPGVEAAFEGGADGGDFRFGAGFFQDHLPFRLSLRPAAQPANALAEMLAVPG